MELLVYFSCCLAAYFFSMTYVGWYGVYLFWAVVLLPPVLTLLSLPSMLSFRIALQAPGKVNRGERAELCLAFSVKGLLPLRSCAFKLRILNTFTGEERVQDMRYGLVSGSESFVRLPTTASGRLVCSIEGLRCYGYLGLFSLKGRDPGAIATLVMPRARAPRELISLESLRDPDPVYRIKPGGGYAEEHELRPYRPGDSVNTIHWKLSSKTEDIIVREPLEPVENEVALLLETSGEMDLDHLYWLSLRLCSINLEHRIYHAGKMSPAICNETEAARAMAELISSPAGPLTIKPLKGSRIFKVCKGEVSSS